MGFKEFFFPKNFQEDMLKSQKETAELIALGKKHMLETRGPKWFNFFMWMPFVGNAAFLSEGRKAKKELTKSSKNKREVTVEKDNQFSVKKPKRLTRSYFVWLGALVILVGLIWLALWYMGVV